MKPKPPCGRNCPKRSAIPNCHDPAVCGDWAAYQEALAAWNAGNAAARRAQDDVETARYVSKPRRYRKEKEQV